MTIQRKGNEIIIRISDKIDIESLQRLMNYLTYSEVTSESDANQEEINNLASTINKGWWEANKNRLLKP